MVPVRTTGMYSQDASISGVLDRITLVKAMLQTAGAPGTTFAPPFPYAVKAITK